MEIPGCVPMQSEVQNSSKDIPSGDEKRHGPFSDPEQAGMFFLFSPFCPELLLLFYKF